MINKYCKNIKYLQNNSSGMNYFETVSLKLHYIKANIIIYRTGLCKSPATFCLVNFKNLQ